MSQQLSASLQRKQGSARQQPAAAFPEAVLEMGGASRGLEGVFSSSAGLQDNESGHLGLGLRRPREDISHPRSEDYRRGNKLGCESGPKEPVSNITKHL